ncbi:hypothetical protein ATM97_29355 [Nocardia sp. MH4]|uniref:DUF3099 family protein n=1 Tax=Nocardia fluminea TaxID=134984 RepID=A0A2N3VDC9_9NOCA|nr:MULTISPECIES: DUF3099 domain-containing protein [Nocardia]MBW0275384.1 hypothetical protein [Nocardia sp. MH4]PKV79605.1 Protein of unknown function (DUF3099) [Nocardia fluminea]WKG08775.1 DUF3099 domain-containing protein [Nocardia sp. PE-7]
MKRSAPGSAADGDERQAALITAVGLSYPEQHRRRVRKYVVLMACRVPSLLLATAVYAAGGPGWVAAAIMGVTLPLSWMAVLIANDRPPREKRLPSLHRLTPVTSSPSTNTWEIWRSPWVNAGVHGRSAISAIRRLCATTLVGPPRSW